MSRQVTAARDGGKVVEVAIETADKKGLYNTEVEHRRANTASGECQSDQIAAYVRAIHAGSEGGDASLSHLLTFRFDYLLFRKQFREDVAIKFHPHGRQPSRELFHIRECQEKENEPNQ